MIRSFSEYLNPNNFLVYKNKKLPVFFDIPVDLEWLNDMKTNKWPKKTKDLLYVAYIEFGDGRYIWAGGTTKEDAFQHLKNRLNVD